MNVFRGQCRTSEVDFRRNLHLCMGCTGTSVSACGYVGLGAMEACFRCSALGLNWEVVALFSSPQPCSWCRLRLFGTFLREAVSSSSKLCLISSCKHAASNVHNRQRQCLKVQKDYFFHSYLKVRVKIHFLENLKTWLA